MTRVKLIATDTARKPSLDLYMLSPEGFSDHVDNKASHCAKLTNDYYQKYDEQKGTQFIFSDLGTYKPNEWNVYSEIKRKLNEDYSIPSHEIRLIQECKTKNAKKTMTQAMDKGGDIRVLFGSTDMLDTGVNAQKRTVAIHHFDTPWRPSDLEQRNGKAIRKGNEIAKHFAGNKVESLSMPWGSYSFIMFSYRSDKLIELLRLSSTSIISLRIATKSNPLYRLLPLYNRPVSSSSVVLGV